MNLYHLRYFVMLAKESHYTRAAEKLCIAQPSLSHAIAQLEQELGVQLFERMGRTTLLTQPGKLFLAEVEKSLAILDGGVRAMAEIAQGGGVIRLGFLRTLGTHFVPELCAGFLRERDDRHVDFRFNSDITSVLLDGLQANEYDVVFCSKVEDERIEFVPVSQQDLVLIVPGGHPLAKQHAVDLADTLSYPYVFFGKQSGLRSVIDRMFEKLGAFPQPAYEVKEDQVIAGLVAQGFGIAVVPYMDLLLRLNVRILQISNPVWERKFYMATMKARNLPPAARIFTDYVKRTAHV